MTDYKERRRAALRLGQRHLTIPMEPDRWMLKEFGRALGELAQAFKTLPDNRTWDDEEVAAALSRRLSVCQAKIKTEAVERGFKWKRGRPTDAERRGEIGEAYESAKVLPMRDRFAKKKRMISE